MALAAAPPAWTADYVGLPFAVLGRDRAGLDCYGLVALVMRERFGVALPLLADGWRGRHGRAELDALARFIAGELAAAWLPVAWPDARLGDLVVLTTHGRPIHVGLLVAERLMLHVQEGADSALARLDGLRWQGRVAGLYRFAGLP